MLALRRLFKKFSRTHTFDESTLPELGSGAGGGGLEEGSGAALVDLATEARLTTPAPSRTPPVRPHAARPALERRPESVVNDIPERLSDKPAGPVVLPATASPSASDGGGRALQSNMWAQLEELEGELFSGNGLMELETHHSNLLRTHSSRQGHLEPGLGPGGEILGPSLEEEEEEEDIFRAQGYLPFSPQTLSPAVQSPPTTQTSRSTLQVLPRTAPGPPSDFEGSGALPQASDQTL